MPIISFTCFLLGMLGFLYFNALILLAFILIALSLYWFCYYLKLRKLQICFSYIYGGLVTGLFLRLSIYFWINKNYHLFILLPIIAVILIIIYEELFKKNYSLNPIVFSEDKNFEIVKNKQQIEEFFSNPERLIGISINEIEKPHNAGLCNQFGSYDFGIAYHEWYTEKHKIEVITKNEICIEISVIEGDFTEKSLHSF
ncbi:hypothetical protein [Acinetobacter sp. NIPH 298]|uniref:hypothetical protein n=1 Tax=Acinetobacter sp. NIPH 298 TaxID=1217692 RepID=UPI0002CD949E|nr:hypothetical protein [Acinetobacter sp. NIPH 298]ENW96679.1 hypothetical protein F903_02450 [Acinetobacter sp. NIPH 298]